MSKGEKILILGGGFAGARAAQDLTKAGFASVTLVDRKDYFEVTYSTLRTLARPEMGARARMRYSEILHGAFHHGDVVELSDDSAKLEDGTQLDFDIAVVATGSSYRSFPIAKSPDALTMDERQAEFAEAHAQLEAAQHILIIGGGPVGVELAGEIADHYPAKSVTVAEGTDRLLPELSPKASRIAETQLRSLGVTILYDKLLSPDDPEYQQADIVYTCVGLVANTGFMKPQFANRLDKAGRIQVDDKMRMKGARNIYAIGDCSTADSSKLGYLADIQGALLARNIISASQGKAMKPYKPSSTMMALVPVGRKKGLAQMPVIGVTTLGLLVNMKQKDMLIGRQYGNLGIKR